MCEFIKFSSMDYENICAAIGLATILIKNKKQMPLLAKVFDAENEVFHFLCVSQIHSISLQDILESYYIEQPDDSNVYLHVLTDDSLEYSYAGSIGG